MRRDNNDNATESQRKTIFKIAVGVLTGEYDRVRELSKPQVTGCIALMRDYELKNNYCFTHGIAGECIKKLSKYSEDFNGNREYKYQRDKEKISAVIPLDFVQLVADYLAGNWEQETEKSEAPKTPEKGLSAVVNPKPIGSPAFSLTIDGKDISTKAQLRKCTKAEISKYVLDLTGFTPSGSKEELVEQMLDTYGENLS